MIVDGKQIAEDMLGMLGHLIRTRNLSPRLLVLTAAPDFATQSFLRIKRRAAERIGVAVELREFPDSVTTEELVRTITTSVSSCDGIIVQLPFPPSVDVEVVLRALPASHDVDAIGEESQKNIANGRESILSPVAGAIREIVRIYDVALEDKEVVVVGQGRLVGAPVALWCERMGARVTRLGRDSKDIAEHTKRADIIVLGAGVPGLLTPAMVSPRAVVFDAGTSESGGKLVGDAEPAVAEVAGLYTPVPGGIGPITISVLFRNLIELSNGPIKR